MEITQNNNYNIKKIHVKLLTKEYESKYSEYIEKSQNSTIYHTIEWRDISCKVFNHKDQFLVAEGDNRIQGVLPLFLVKGILGRRLVSVPLRDKGGPLYDSPEVLEQLLETSKTMMVEQKCRYMQINSWRGLDFPNNKPDWMVQDSTFFIQTLALEKNTDLIHAKFHESVRRAIRKSQREGVTCYWGNTLKDMKDFYYLFLLTRKKLGVPTYGFKLFYEIWERMIQKGSAGLVLAQYQGAVIAGLIVFFFHDTVMLGYAASHEKYLNLRPNNLVYWEAIKDFCVQGYRYFDFGAGSPENPSLEIFKARFGAISEVFPVYYAFNSTTKPFGMDYDSRKYHLARKLFSKLPLGISKRIGPIITRQLS